MPTGRVLGGLTTPLMLTASVWTYPVKVPSGGKRAASRMTKADPFQGSAAEGAGAAAGTRGVAER